MEFKKEDLVKLYDCVFSSNHSDGFKAAEIKDLLTDKRYFFMEKPKKNWAKELNRRLIELGYEPTEY